ncbi:MAG TPA: cytochrome bc complex cytochrome b subunit [Nitrospirota bacterium]|nr:cytochrome bc complex cytochrome b subunit [Nitrospirota bacterium]
MGKRIKNWLEVRIGLDELVRTHLTGYLVPKNLNLFHTLGLVALAGFVVQVLTGFLLIIYYVPLPEHAFRTVQHIMVGVPFGWLFRLMHVVGSNLIVAAVACHMLSVFFMNSYKKPRELTWITGASMLLITLTFCLSGYLLPWSQLSYWATTIVTNLPSALPYVGAFVVTCLQGGQNVSGTTLGRFFALHVVVLPAILVALVSVHFFLVRRIGISSPPFGRSGERKPWTMFRHEDHPDGQPFFPHFMLKEASMIMAFFILMFLVITFAPALFLPEDANIPADPFKTPTHVKPEWYFLAPYQMLKLVPNKFIGISLQIIMVLVFLLWPLLDVKQEDNILKRRALLAFFLAATIGWVVLTIWGKYS